MAVPIFISIFSICNPLLLQHLQFSGILIFVNLKGVKGHLVVLICISFHSNKAEHCFIWSPLRKKIEEWD